MWARTDIVLRLKKPEVVLAGASFASLVTGAAVSHLLTRRGLEARFNDLLDQEVEVFKEQYRMTERGKIKNEVNEEVKKDLFEKVIDRMGYDQTSEIEEGVRDEPEDPEEEEEGVPDGPPSTRKNVFPSRVKNRDFDFMAVRDELEPGQPFIISDEEFGANESSYTQTQLTYFAGDKTLAEADDNDIPPHEVERVVGWDNLERFGVGSNDANLVYVRNDRLEQDFVIALSEGKYAVEVLGEQKGRTLEHSDERARSRRPRKFSGHDD